jgi:hypothetical protein
MQNLSRETSIMLGNMPVIGLIILAVVIGPRRGASMSG